MNWKERLVNIKTLRNNAKFKKNNITGFDKMLLHKLKTIKIMNSQMTRKNVRQFSRRQ